MNQIWGASYAEGVRLAGGGCALPYLDALRGKEHFYQRAMYVEEIGGYLESYAIDRGESTGYAIALRVGTDRARGAIVTCRELVLPWPDHSIDWNYDPEDVLPKGKLNDYGKLLESRLPAVLNERRLLNRGVPVEGLLCGCSFSPIPESFRRDSPAMAKIILVDDSGVRVHSSIQLTILTPRRQRGRMRDRTSSRGLKIA